MAVTQSTRNIIAAGICLGMAGSACAERAFEFEASYLNRSDAGSDLSVDSDTGEDMSARDANLGHGLGFTVSVRNDTSDGEQLIGSFSYFGSWDGSDKLVSADEDIDPVSELQSDDDDFTDAYLHSISYESRLLGAELSKTMQLSNPSANAFYGVSFLSLDEEFEWHSQDNAAGNTPGTNGYGQYNIETDNRLIGLVAGINAERKIGAKSTLLGSLKLGVYANRAKQTSHMENDVDLVAPDIGDGSKKEWKAAGLLQGRVGIEFTPKQNMQVRVGYQALYLSNVALAPDQITFGGELAGSALDSRLSKLDTDHILLHGPYLGLHISF